MYPYGYNLIPSFSVMPLWEGADLLVIPLTFGVVNQIPISQAPKYIYIVSLRQGFFLLI